MSECARSGSVLRRRAGGARTPGLSPHEIKSLTHVVREGPLRGSVPLTRRMTVSNALRVRFDAGSADARDIAAHRRAAIVTKRTMCSLSQSTATFTDNQLGLEDPAFDRSANQPSNPVAILARTLTAPYGPAGVTPNELSGRYLANR